MKFQYSMDFVFVYIYGNGDITMNVILLYFRNNLWDGRIQ